MSTTTTAPALSSRPRRQPAAAARADQARAEHKAGRLDAEGLRAVEDAAILEVIELQRAVGLQPVTDGEFRRTSWHMDFIYQLEGITQVQGESLHVQFKNEQGTYDYAPPAMRVAGKVELGETIFADAFNFLRDHAHAEQTPKLTIPSPSMVHYRGGNAAIDRESIRMSTPSGMTSSRPTRDRSTAPTSSAAATCSSTTPASPTSTIRHSASTSRRSVATRPPARAVHRRAQPGPRKQAGGHGRSPPPLPRQQPVDVGR